MNNFFIILTVLSLHRAAAVPETPSPPPRALFELTQNAVKDAVDKFLKALPQNSPLSGATTQESDSKASIVITLGGFRWLEAMQVPGTRRVVLTTQSNPLLHFHSFYSSFSVTTLVKTDAEFQKEVATRLTSFVNFMTQCFAFRKLFPDSKTLLDEVQKLLAKNSGHKIEDIFESHLDEPLKKKTKNGQDFEFAQSLTSVLGIPNFVRVAVQHYGTRAFVQIDMPNSQIRAVIVPVASGDPLDRLEQSVLKAFKDAQLISLPDFDKVKDAINSGIGKCAKFQKMLTDGPSPYPAAQFLQYIEEVKQEEISAEDAEGFGRVRRLLSGKLGVQKSVKAGRRLPDDSENKACAIHSGQFTVLPVVLTTFPYIQIKYDAGGRYVNEQFIQIGEESAFKEKLKQFAEEVTQNTEKINELTPEGTPPAVVTKPEAEFLELIRKSASPFTCDFSGLENKGPRGSCALAARGKASSTIIVSRRKDKGSSFFEVSMIPKFNSESQNPTTPVQTVSVGLLQASPTFDILAQRIRDFVKTQQ